MTPEMTLSLVIPVWNDPEHLLELLDQAVNLRLFSQIIIADDASDPPCDPAQLGFDSNGFDGELLYLRSDRQRGAGHARNIGLDAVSGSHVLFFDADDRLLPGLALLLQDLQGHSFDFCLFKHADSRQQAEGLERPLPLDAQIWQQAGIQPGGQAGDAGTLHQLSTAQAEQLCLISAYPWNKIYRTTFLRDQGIRCTEIPVHNDAALHWLSFIKAQTILASNRLGCTHVVEKGGSRLTNRRQRDRLQVFQALEQICDALESSPGGGRFIVPYLGFCDRLFTWILNQALDPGLRPQFQHRACAHLLARLRPEYVTLFAQADPAAAARLNAILAGGRR